MNPTPPPSDHTRLLAQRLLNALTTGHPLQTTPTPDQEANCPPTSLPLPLSRPLLPGLPLTPPGNLPTEATRELISTLQCIRRGQATPHHLLHPLTSLLELMPPDEVQRALREPLEARISAPPPPSPTYEGLLQSLSAYLTRPQVEELVNLARHLRAALTLPCAPDPRLERERRGLEERMHRIGLLLGLVFPLVFVAGFLFYRSILAALATAVAIMVVWTIVRHQGTRYARANIEQAWRSCEQAVGEVSREWEKPRGKRRPDGRRRASARRWWRPYTP